MTTVLLALALVVQAPPPDTVRQARYERTLSSVSDSLDAVRGAIAAFPIDLARVSPDLVLARTTRVRQSCHGAARGRQRDRLGIEPPQHRDNGRPRALHSASHAIEGR